MKTLKAILLIIALAVLVISIDTGCRLRQLNARLDRIKDTWILATTPVSRVEEIEVEELKTPDGKWIPPEKGE